MRKTHVYFVKFLVDFGLPPPIEDLGSNPLPQDLKNHHKWYNSDTIYVDTIKIRLALVALYLFSELTSNVNLHPMRNTFFFCFCFLNLKLHLTSFLFSSWAWLKAYEDPLIFLVEDILVSGTLMIPRIREILAHNIFFVTKTWAHFKYFAIQQV